jgi:putative peptide zinc metalloprotease protein
MTTLETGLPLDPVEFERRLTILSDLNSLAALPLESLTPLVPSLEESHYPAGTVIVSDTASATGTRRFVIVSGQAEVTAPGPNGAVPLATLGPGELFGEAAVLEPGGDRHATITAQTNVEVLSFDGPTFEQLVASDEMAQRAFGWIAGHRMTARFLKLASPFAALTPDQTHTLSKKIRRQTVAAGDVVVRQGDEGDTAFLVMKGKLDAVLEAEDGSEKRLATMRAGMLFGETALLNRTPRNATVRALEPSELLVLSRTDILDAMSSVRDVRAKMVELLQMRALPRRVDGVEVHERQTPEGQTIRVLKDRARGRYYRLSPQGWFLWQRLDGRHTIRHLTLDYIYEFKSLSPQVIADVVGGLAAAGFIVAPELPIDELMAKVPRWQRALLTLRRIATWQKSIHGIDGALTRAYRGGVWMFYTIPVQVVLTLVIVTGFVAFVRGTGTMPRAIAEIGPQILLFLIPLNILAVFIHELGHAFAVKAFGREVPRAGIGWFWFGPMAFVDTSDMWLTSRWPRIAVNLAGLHTNVIVAGLASLAALYSPSLFWSAVLWQSALMSYWMVAVNLNPLLEYDGYWVLCDWLDIPNLRAKSMSWLGHDLVPALRTPGGLRGHAFDLAYGLASVLYVVAMVVVVVIVYRYTVQGWMATVMPAWAASGLAWLAALLVAGGAGSALISDLRAPRKKA